ncbi:MAG: TetR/AcrR family transcriptional regulator [Desulfamplus sp.]|nr:TetR/AcrR family transcriptional regulator [Desulfamplus sp.]MBF0258850.1 TetR/AcrR family transcriptional regulator [Desulfamplus sp.]
MNISRKERDDQRRRDEILDAALSIFATQGFHGTTMAQISQEAQYPLGTIYKYFSSKKQIYHDLVMERVHQLGQILLSISNRKDISAKEKLKASLFAKTKFYKSNSDFIRIYISERSNIDAVVIPKLNEKVNRMHEKMITLFQKIFEQGMDDEFKPYPPKEMAILFTELAHSIAWSSLFQNGNNGNEKQLGEAKNRPKNENNTQIDYADIENAVSTNINAASTDIEDTGNNSSDDDINDETNQRLNMIFDMFMNGVSR